MEILELIKTIGGAASAIVVLVGLPWSIIIALKNNKKFRTELKENRDSHIKDIVTDILDSHTAQIKDAISPISVGLQSVLRSDLRLNGEKYIKRFNESGKRMTAKEWEEYDKMFKAYRDLGGNSFIVDLYNDVQKVPHDYE